MLAPLVEELVPAPDPFAVARTLAHLPHLLFLDSADRHAERGRYSYVTADPAAFRQFDSLDDVRETWERSRFRTSPDLPPFQCGVAGLFGYGLGRQLETLPAPRGDDFALPDLALGVYEWVVSFDHATNRAWIVATDARHIREVKRRLGAAAEPLPFVRQDEPSLRSGERFPLPGHRGVSSNFTRARYEAAVRRAVEYVHAGDVFQVNIAQTLSADLREHPFELYARLRATNPAPFAAYFDAGDFQLASASPERFLEVSPSGRVRTKPIKGTRPRGRTPGEDAALAAELLANPKDRAENVMIVDLLRNDLGRVCEYGSVRVPQVCALESYRDVHHLVSGVTGQLRPGKTAFDLLKAAFPGGSVTGAPKVRAMEIIAELEPTARGPYCGSLGWIGFDGAMDTNILIRTFTAGREGVQFPVGGGIVADSTPEREYEETLHKAAGLLRALEERP